MSREIKFRVWDKTLKKMFYPSGEYRIWLTNEGVPLIEFSSWKEEYNDEDDLYDSEFEIHQYTGLKDENGKEIYEGDILKYSEDSLLKVFFVEGCFMTVEIGIPDNCPLWLYDYNKESVVIGNVFENPELIN